MEPNTKYFLIATTETQLVISRDYDSLEEAYDNKEFLERSGYSVRLKVKEM